jgi:sec-independent protein translocase protein TatB
MPSFQDGALIFFLALLLFGPKKLPELARYVGKLMGEFRRASSEFRIQMEDEFRLAEQAEQQKKIAEMEAAAPTPPAIEPIPEPEHPHMPPLEVADTESADSWTGPAAEENPVTPEATPEATPEPLPIATSGDLNLMPPATGLPTARSASLTGVFDSIPQASEAPQEAPHETEAAPHA